MSAFRRRGLGSSHIRYLGSRGGGRGRGDRGGRGHQDYGGQQSRYNNPQSSSGYDSLDHRSGPQDFLDHEEDLAQNMTTSGGVGGQGPSHRFRSPDRTRISFAEGGLGHTGQRSRSKSPGQGQPSNSGGSDKPPPHLKGAQIGLWYRDRNRASGRRGQNSGERGGGYRGAKNPGLWHRDNPKRDLFAANMWIDLTQHRQDKINAVLGKLGTPVGHTFDLADSDPQRTSASSGIESLFDTTHTSYLIPIETLRDSSLDDTLREELQIKLASNRRYQDMLNSRRALPAYGCMNDILDLVVQNQVVVISGETGSGKTTQIGQFILDRWISDGNGSICNIVCTQPRRISAISVAQRVAEERDEPVGGKSIGYSIRLESKLPKRKGGTITYCTTGVVLQYLKSDPFLNKVSHIILDEIHERDVLCDFLIAIVKDLIPLRPDLKVILMSATLNAPHFQTYFDNCPLYHISGVIYPVTVYYLEDIIETTNFVFPQKVSNSRFGSGPGRSNSNYKSKAAQGEQQQYEILMGPYLRTMERSKEYSSRTIGQIRRQESEELCLDLIEVLIQNISESDSTNSSILVFLPGWDNISTLHNQLTGSGKFGRNNLIIPLHSMMPTVNQREVFDSPPPGKRKIILSTNIAETSITINDIVHVIDCGKIKMTNFDIELNVETLKPEWVSLANAKQRRGRAGRVQPGVCYHLFSKGREALMEEFMKPEVLRKRLEEVVLQIKMLKLGNAANFFNKLLDPPDERSVDLAVKRLLQLNALDLEENLTPLGFHLAQLPMDPMTGRMILLGAIFSCCDPILSVAASLNFKDAFVIPLGQEKNVDEVRRQFANRSKSDHLVLVRAIAGYEDAKMKNLEREYCCRNYLSAGTLKMLINLKGQFAQNLYDQKFLPSTNWRDPHMNVNSGNDALVKAVICAGLYPNVGKVRTRKRYSVVHTLEDGRVNFHPKSVNSDETSFESPFVVYQKKVKTTSIFLHDTTMVSPFPLIFFGGQLSFITEGGYDTIKVDQTIRFHCRKEIHDIILGLRAQLDRFLEDKIRNPGPTIWGRKTDEGDLLSAIAELLTAEDREIMNEDTAESQSDEEVTFKPTKY